MSKKEELEVKAELDKKFEKEVFGKPEPLQDLKEAAGLKETDEEAAKKYDPQVEHLVDAAKKQNLEREARLQITAKHVSQDVPGEARKPYYLTPDQEKSVKAILKNSGADTASQIKAFDQLKEVLELV